MATGGIGGVHPGAETSLDISADLSKLTRIRVVVVCSGPKAENARVAACIAAAYGGLAGEEE